MAKRRRKSPCSAKFKKVVSTAKRYKKRVVRAKKDFLDKIFDIFK
jgi:hypothetical protein